MNVTCFYKRRWIEQHIRSVLLLVCIFQAHSSGAIDYLDYYRKIAAAEEAIVNARYRDGLELYNAAFSRYMYSNPIDCYIAAQVAAYTGDSLRCIDYLYQGIACGLPPETVSANIYLASFGNQEGIGILASTKADSCIETYTRRINHNARSKAIALIQYDQRIVRQLREGSIYTADGSALKPVYQPVWDSLLNEVIDLTVSAGFPAQKIIGTMNGDDGLFAASPNNVLVYYILIHHRNAWSRMGALLREELMKGNITRRCTALSRTTQAELRTMTCSTSSSWRSALQATGPAKNS